MSKTLKPKNLPSAQDLRITADTEKAILLTWTSTQKRYWAIVVKDLPTLCHCWTGTTADTIAFCKEIPSFTPFIESIEAVTATEGGCASC